MACHNPVAYPARRGRPPQGNKPAEILQVAELLGPSCNQTIILGWGAGSLRLRGNHHETGWRPPRGRAEQLRRGGRRLDAGGRPRVREAGALPVRGIVWPAGVRAAQHDPWRAERCQLHPTRPRGA